MKILACVWHVSDTFCQSSVSGLFSETLWCVPLKQNPHEQKSKKKKNTCKNGKQGCVGPFPLQGKGKSIQVHLMVNSSIPAGKGPLLHPPITLEQ